MRRISSAYRLGVFALGAWGKGHPTIRHTKSGMVRDTDTYYEYKTPIYKFIAYENNFTRN